MFFLSLLHFSTEDGFPHILEPSCRAISFHWSRSTPHYPVSVRENHPFDFEISSRLPKGRNRLPKGGKGQQEEDLYGRERKSMKNVEDNVTDNRGNVM
jgi:hypothetical protein